MYLLLAAEVVKRLHYPRGVTQQSIRGGCAARSTPLPFYIRVPFLTERVPLSYTVLPLKNGTS